MQFDPIGYVECKQRYRYEAARQASIAPDNEAWIRLEEREGLLEALQGLSEFERIWVIYELHLNETWHPFVQPPREGLNKLGVFATRSPHRPNRIGLSCVLLRGIKQNKLHIAQHDLLDATPVLDIKPYVPYADAFPEASAGWIDQQREQVYALEFSESARAQVDWVYEHAGWDLINFLQVQLRTDPVDGKRKRIERTVAGYCIAFRTWRIDYRVDEKGTCVEAVAVRSGYSAEDLMTDKPDRYKDKTVHREFNAVFGS